LSEGRSGEENATRYLDLVSQLNEYLEIKRPSLDELIHFVAVRTLKPWSAERAFIARVDRDGVFREIAYFGFQFEDSAGWAEVNIMDQVPMADAARSGAIVVANEEHITEVYKDLVDRRSSRVGRSIIDVPILKGGVPVGVLGIVFAGEIPADESFLPFLRSLASCIVFSMDDNRRKMTTKRTRGLHVELTERQKNILEMMAQGLTNSVMAQRLGFSESLIRQETVKIYRNLNVNNRHEASEVFASQSK
jgi:DNA-binding CsgD family transcriptional regulator